MRAVGNLKQT